MSPIEAAGLTVEAATVYEELFVPALFQQWTRRAADAARLGPGQRVLDVACGTGVLAREARGRVGPSGAVVGLDRDPGMLAVASRLASDIEWRQGLAESLPFPDRDFDAVVSQFGLMFFAEPRRAVAEMLRVVRPGGRVVIAVWDALERTPAYVAFVDLLDRLFGRSVADALKLPFAMGDRDALAALLAEAGASSWEVGTHDGEARFASLETWVASDAKGWLQLDDDQHRHLLAAAREALAAFVTPTGAVAFCMPAHVAVAARA